METNFNLPRLRYDIGFDTNWIFEYAGLQVNSFYETLINYDQENIDRVERYGLEMLQKLCLIIDLISKYYRLGKF